NHVLQLRRGTLPGRRARSADELALLIDRAGDVTFDELRARLATPEEGVVGAPIAELVDRGRLIEIEIPTATGRESRSVLTENGPRYAAAFGVALPNVSPSDVAFPRAAAEREVLARFVAIAGPVSIDDVRRRYDFDAVWV